MVKVSINEFHWEVGLTTNLTTRFLLFCLWFLCHFPFIFQTHATYRTFTRQCWFGLNVIRTNITIKFLQGQNFVSIGFWNTVANLVETCVAAIAVEDFIDFLIAFSGETDFAVGFKEGLEFLLGGRLFLFEGLFHVHFHDCSNFHGIVQKLFSLVTVTFFEQ